MGGNNDDKLGSLARIIRIFFGLTLQEEKKHLHFLYRRKIEFPIHCQFNTIGFQVKHLSFFRSNMHFNLVISEDLKLEQ